VEQAYVHLLQLSLVPRFSEHFALGRSQPELDFVDIDLTADLSVYVDPFAISLYPDDLSRRASDAIVWFFQTAIQAIRDGREDQAIRMLGNLSEPNETRLGVSRDRPQGRGVSGKQAFDLYRSIANSEAAKSGLVTDISECDLFIEGIGPDKISDMTTNIIRDLLIDYTGQQCALHGIPTVNTPSGPTFDHQRGMWREQYRQLPRYDGSRVILVPKMFVRRHLALNSQDYLNKHVFEFLQAEHLNSMSALVETLKNGSLRVTKKSLKENYPCTKEWMAEFTAANPEVLATYKTLMADLAKAERRNEAASLNGDNEFNEGTFAQALIESLMRIPPGNDDASAYHSLMIGIMEFLFWPQLTAPVKEAEIHEGRKRIDILYTNAADSGFFHRMATLANVVAHKVPVECSKDPANPEVDQLAGRFAPNRGRLGFLVYRNTTDRNRLIARCRDTAVEGRGFILPLGDAEVIGMLEDVRQMRRERIGTQLYMIYNRLIN
jgi:hypothetical protein